MSGRPLHFSAELRPQRRGWLGVALPRASAAALGSRLQVRVRATIRGVSFETTAFPGGDGSHFLPLNATLRQRLGLVEGEAVEVAVEVAPARPPALIPDELRAELSRSEKRATPGGPDGCGQAGGSEVDRFGEVTGGSRVPFARRSAASPPPPCWQGAVLPHRCRSGAAHSS
jgi:hypothetical protein